MLDPACPICGQPAYSSTGQHPQCALVAAQREWDEETRLIRQRRKQTRRRRKKTTA
jgi:uncharacterized Zn finger protein (UPF0148 family)